MSATTARRVLFRWPILVMAVTGAFAFSVAAGTPAYAAQDVSLMSNHTQTVRAGQKASVRVVATDYTHRCVLALARGGRVVSKSRPVSVNEEYVRWSWRVPGRAASLTWQARVTCQTYNLSAETQTVVAQLKVRGRGGKVRRPSAGTPSGISYGNALRPDGWDDPPNSTGEDTAGPTLPQPSSYQPGYYQWGGCEYWANFRRPDVTNGSFVVAENWAQWARDHGFPVDKNPRAGDIAVWQADGTGAGPGGHVAYVESVDGGVVVVSEMNWNGSKEPTTRVLNEYRLASAEFIHSK